MLGTGEAVVEFGSGSSTKTPILLRAVEPAAYVPIDISGDFLRESADALQAEFPGPADPSGRGRFHAAGSPCPPRSPALPKLGFFPGSTIGNLVPRTAVDLLRAMKETLGEGARLLIGMDRIKDVDVLLAAYDDAAGVTAAFNLNLLHRINAELDGDIPGRGLPPSRDLERRDEPDRDASRGAARRRLHRRRPALRVRGRARRSTPRTATNTAIATAACCFAPPAGAWSTNGPTSDEWFSIILAEAEPPRFAP